jgi:uncharacterized glyoxalase superfamily protein PhnB
MQVHRSVAGEDGRARYAELEFGGNLLMIAPIEDTPFGKLMVQPDEVGGVETQVCYLHVDDVAIHYARARAAGADIVLDIEDEANSGRGYSCRDPEGHLWNFGSYHPWRRPGGAPDRRRAGGPADGRRERSGLTVLLALLIGALVVSWGAQRLPDARADTARSETPAEEPAAADRHRREVEKRTPEQPAAEEPTEPKERPERRADVEIAGKAHSELAEARAALVEAERQAKLASAEAEETRNARLAAETAAEETRGALAAARKEAEAARAEAARERARRIAAEEAADRPRRRVAGYRRILRRRPVWCYDPDGPNPSPGRRGRLVGFCKG